MHENTATQPQQANAWSETQQQQTRQALRERPVAPDGRLHLKHPTDGFAYINEEDLVEGRFILYLKPGGRLVRCDDVEDLLRAGWAID